MNVSLLRDTILLASDCAGAMCPVTIAILVFVSFRDGLAPMCTSFKVPVSSIGARIDDVDVNAFTAIMRVQILVECAKCETTTV